MAHWLLPAGTRLDKQHPHYYGIDLGTTHTLVARIDGQQAMHGNGTFSVDFLRFRQYSPLPLDAPVEDIYLTSALALDDQLRPYVGRKVYQLKGSPGFERYRNLFYHFKLDLGISASVFYYQRAAHPDYNHPAKIAGKILNYCRKQTLQSDVPWTQVVITVPASFQHAQRNDVLAAAQYARIETEGKRLLADEPNAALIGYLNEMEPARRQALIAQESRWLIIDFGGGTCDLSVLEVRHSPHDGLLIRNVAISRYQDVGGQDLDRLLVEKYVLDQIPLPASPTGAHLLVEGLCALMEKLKIRLSQRLTATAPADDWASVLPCLDEQQEQLQDIELNTGEAVTLSLTLSARQLREATELLFTHEPYHFSTIEKELHTVPLMVNDILDKASMTKAQITHVLLAGGSVQNPYFVEGVRRLFPKSQVILPPTPDLLVAKGAAVLSFFRHAIGRELIRPVLSDTIGVLTREGFYPIAAQGTPLPLEARVGGFRLQSNLQSTIDIPLCLQGASHPIGNIHLRFDTPPSLQSYIELHTVVNEEKIIEVSLYIDGNFRKKISVEGQRHQGSADAPLLEDLQQAIKQGKTAEQRRILKELMRQYFDTGNYQRLAEVAEHYCELFDGTDPSVLNYLYIAYWHRNYFDKAEHFLKEAIRYAPNAEYLHHNHSLVIERRQGAEAALHYLENLPETLRQGPSLRMRRALLLHRLKGNEAARPLMQQLVEEVKSGKIKVGGGADLSKMQKIAKIVGENLNLSTESGEQGAKNIEENNLLHAPSLPRKHST